MNPTPEEIEAIFVKTNFQNAEKCKQAAVAAFRTGDTEEAEALLRRAIVLAPTYVEGWLGLIQIYNARGLESEALAVCKEGLRRVPWSLHLNNEYGTIILKTGDLRRGWPAAKP